MTCEHDKPTKILLGAGDEPLMLWCHNCGAIFQMEIDKWILPHFWSQLHDKPANSDQDWEPCDPPPTVQGVARDLVGASEWALREGLREVLRAYGVEPREES